MSDDCPECYGTGGLYDSRLGINDECPACAGTGFCEGGEEYSDLEEYLSELLAEIKRLREAIADVTDDMVENLPNNLRVYVSKLRKVIE